jgi:hypothetical protein
MQTPSAISRFGPQREGIIWHSQPVPRKESKREHRIVDYPDSELPALLLKKSCRTGMFPPEQTKSAGILITCNEEIAGRCDFA